MRTCSASGLSRATRLLMRWICCAALLSSCGCRVMLTVQRSSRDTVACSTSCSMAGRPRSRSTYRPPPQFRQRARSLPAAGRSGVNLWGRRHFRHVCLLLRCHGLLAAKDASGQVDTDGMPPQSHTSLSPQRGSFSTGSSAPAGALQRQQEGRFARRRGRGDTWLLCCRRGKTVPVPRGSTATGGSAQCRGSCWAANCCCSPSSTDRIHPMVPSPPTTNTRRPANHSSPNS